MRRLLVLVIAVIALVSGVGALVAAQDAGSDQDPCPTGAATPAASPMAATEEAAAAMEASPMASPAAAACAVEIRDFAFNPPTIEIAVGTTVTWTNNDTVAHTATANDGSFNSENLDSGQSYSHTFDTAGTIDYVCLYHPNMTGTITVT